MLAFVETCTMHIEVSYRYALPSVGSCHGTLIEELLCIY